MFCIYKVIDTRKLYLYTRKVELYLEAATIRYRNINVKGNTRWYRRLSDLRV
jgi:hypothetical protein